MCYRVMTRSHRSAMSEATFTFRLDGNLKSAFAEAAKSQDRTSAQLLRTLMRQAVQSAREAAEHDAWFRAEVEQGLREADDPSIRPIPDEEVRAEFAERRAAALRRISGDDR
jgi:predicted transcriptional regulator